MVRWQYSGLDWNPVRGGAGAPAAGSSAEAAASSSASSDAPPGFMAMNGFPGVYVGVTEEVLGVIRDTRPLAPRPSYVRCRYLCPRWFRVRFASTLPLPDLVGRHNQSCGLRSFFVPSSIACRIILSRFPPLSCATYGEPHLSTSGKCLSSTRYVCDCGFRSCIFQSSFQYLVAVRVRTACRAAVSSIYTPSSRARLPPFNGYAGRNCTHGAGTER